MIKKFDHIAIVVPDLDEAMEHYTKLFDTDKRRVVIYRDYEDTDVNTGIVDVMDFALIEVGEVWFELIAPKKADGLMAKFLEKSGPGIHHIGMTSDNIVEEWKKQSKLKDDIGVLEKKPRVDQYDVSYWFLHPKKNYGVLWEVDAWWTKTSVSDMTPVEPTPNWDEVAG